MLAHDVLSCLPLTRSTSPLDSASYMENAHCGGTAAAAAAVTKGGSSNAGPDHAKGESFSFVLALGCLSFVNFLQGLNTELGKYKKESFLYYSKRRLAASRPH